MEYIPVITVVISFVSLVIVILTFLRNGSKESKEELKKRTEANVKVNMKLDQLCSNTNDIKTSLDITARDVKEIRDKQIVHEQRIKVLEKEVFKEE